jgi:SAM-dependent methyltransferase
MDTDATVAFLRPLCGEGPILELGAGTGRIAIPLAASGVSVDAIESSPAMIERLRHEAGGDRVNVVMGDFASVPTTKSKYSMIFVVDSTLYHLRTQEEQLLCVANVARHLGAGGFFVVHASVPNLVRLSQRQATVVRRTEANRCWVEFSRHDQITQRVDTEQVLLSDQGLRVFPMFYRYVWPSELDLMAEIAGLKLKVRFGGWRREPFTSSSWWHVSVYVHPP